MTIGQRLRTARESQRMTVGDVARRTFMQPRFLQAIEEDNLAIIPESHRRIFVREFAKAVGINAEELYPLLDSIAPAPTQGAPAQRPAYTFVDGETEPEKASAPVSLSPPPSARRTERSLPDTDRPSLGSVVRGVSEGMRDKMSGEGGPRMLIIAGVVLIVLVGGYFLYKGLTGKSSTPPPGPTDTTSQVQVLPRSDDSTTEAGGGPAGEDSLTLVGRTTGKVWFSLVADNQHTETGTLDSGVERRWRADKIFRLSLSNAGDLPLTLNGRSLGVLGPKKTSVRNVTIDSAGVRGTAAGGGGAARPVVRRAQPRSSSNTGRRTTPSGPTLGGPTSPLR